MKKRQLIIIGVIGIVCLFLFAGIYIFLIKPNLEFSLGYDQNGSTSDNTTADLDSSTLPPIANFPSTNLSNATTTLLFLIAPSNPNECEEIFFAGQVMGGNESIIEYEWSSNKDGILSNQATFSLKAGGVVPVGGFIVEKSSLSAGNHVISFRTKDNTNTWSSPVTQNLNVVANQKPVAVISSDDSFPSSAQNNILAYASSSSDSEGS